MSKIGALSALVFAFGVLVTVAPATASAHTSSYGSYGSYGGSHGCGCDDSYNNSYYGSSYPSGSSASSAASASASASSNNNVNVNVNVPVTVVGGGYVAPIAQPVYSPVVYNYPTVPTYYGNYNTNQYAYTQPVYTSGYNYNYNSGYNYNNGYNYNSGYNYNTGLSATCSANTTSANIGQGVTWTSSVTGGSGYYTYSWSGSNGLYGSASAITATYNNPGTQYAQVTVTSNNGQSVTAQCTNSVVIGNGSYNGNGNNGNGLTIGCAAGASDVSVGTPVTWSAEVTGGSGTYTYAWSGTDGLAGSQTSVATTYETPGVKQAVVIVTSSNGMTGSQSCTPLKVLGGGNGGNGSNVGTGSTGTTVTPAANANNSGLSAASLFSLANIPWGWVAVLIILVLFGTVMYMLFNKSKI